MSYTVGKLRDPAFHWTGGHDHLFVSIVAARVDAHVYMVESWGELSLRL